MGEHGAGDAPSRRPAPARSSSQRAGAAPRAEGGATSGTARLHSPGPAAREGEGTHAGEGSEGAPRSELHFVHDQVFLQKRLPEIHVGRLGELKIRVELVGTGAITFGPHDEPHVEAPAGGDRPPEGSWDVEVHGNSQQGEHGGREREMMLALGRKWDYAHSSFLGMHDVVEETALHLTLHFGANEHGPTVEVGIEGEIVLHGGIRLIAAFNFVKVGQELSGEPENEFGTFEVQGTIPIQSLGRSELGPGIELSDVRISTRITAELEPHWTYIWSTYGRPLLSRVGQAALRAGRVLMTAGEADAAVVGSAAVGVAFVVVVGYAIFLEYQHWQATISSIEAWNERKTKMQRDIYLYCWGYVFGRKGQPQPFQSAYMRAGHEQAAQDIQTAWNANQTTTHEEIYQQAAARGDQDLFSEVFHHVRERFIDNMVRWNADPAHNPNAEYASYGESGLRTELSDRLNEAEWGNSAWTREGGANPDDRNDALADRL